MVEEINEFAIIFKRKKSESEYELVEEFVPYKVVEGYYYDLEDIFIDSEGNTYSHIASTASIGNVYAARKNIYETIKSNVNRSLYQIKNNILAFAQNYEYYKNTDDTSDEYGIVKMKNKKNGKITKFEDKDTDMYYEIYSTVISENETFETTTTKTNHPVVKSKEESKSKEKSIIVEKKYETPKEIIDDIKETIKGQDEAIETIVTLLWMRAHYPNIPKSNILLLGPSGVGKTAIFNKLKKLLNVPLAIYAIPGTTQAGYKGSDLQEMLLNLYYESGEDVAKAEKGIVFIDEFDKLATSHDTGKVGTIAIQNELLKLIEGYNMVVDIDLIHSFSIDTSNILFVCCGAFANLFEESKEKVVGFNNYQQKSASDKKITTEDFINYGIISELIGRLPVVVQLNKLEREHLKDILLNSSESLFTTLVTTLNNEGIEIENLDETIDLIVDNAMSKNIGARGLIGPIRNMFIKIFYEVGNNKDKYEKVILRSNIVNDNSDFILVPKKVKKKVKTDSMTKV